ncbi:MAG TPA: hypothetical protein VH082_12180, partial [Rudaea sp.]|nr:hypothetical protein [Rudaea sp.]
VTTTAELRSALSAASDGGANQDDGTDIFLATGTYSTSDGLGRFFYLNTSPTASLHLWGGYNADCTQRVDDASATILDGNDATQVLVARSALGDVDILNLTVQNANTDQYGAGIAVNDSNVTTSGDVLLRDLIIRNNHTSYYHGGFRAFARGTHMMYFDNNLVVDNSADRGYGAGELYGQAQIYVRYDTIANNIAQGSTVGGLLCAGVPNCEIANSVFWQNTNADLYVNYDAVMYFDDVTQIAGNTPSTNANPIVGDPLFADPATGNYHLGDGSPLLAVSTYLHSDSDNDIEGHNLPLTGTTDVGAYVDTIFNDNLETSP